MKKRKKKKIDKTEKTKSERNEQLSWLGSSTIQKNKKKRVTKLTFSDDFCLNQLMIAIVSTFESDMVAFEFEFKIRFCKKTMRICGCKTEF